MFDGAAGCWLVTSRGPPYPSRSPRAHPPGWTRTQLLASILLTASSAARRAAHEAFGALLRFARQPCFCVCSTGLMCSRTGHGASDLDEIWHDCSRRPFDGREPYVRAPQPRAAAVRHSRAPRRQKLWLSMVQMRDGAPRSARRKTSRCNFSRPCVFANFEAHGIVSREHRSPLKPSF